MNRKSCSKNWHYWYWKSLVTKISNHFSVSLKSELQRNLTYGKIRDASVKYFQTAIKQTTHLKQNQISNLTSRKVTTGPCTPHPPPPPPLFLKSYFASDAFLSFSEAFKPYLAPALPYSRRGPCTTEKRHNFCLENKLTTDNYGLQN